MREPNLSGAVAVVTGGDLLHRISPRLVQPFACSFEPIVMRA